MGEQEKILTDDKEGVIQYIKENTSVNQTIFVYPWNPEVYFLAGRSNATKYYTPYAFFTEAHQKEMISELQSNKPAIVVYNPEMKFGNLTPETLPLVYKFILENFGEVGSFGDYKLMK